MFSLTAAPGTLKFKMWTLRGFEFEIPDLTKYRNTMFNSSSKLKRTIVAGMLENQSLTGNWMNWKKEPTEREIFS